MKLPNKVIRYNESIVSKFAPILNILESSSMSASELYSLVKNKVEDVSDFLNALDCLFALGKVNYNSTERRLHYVVSNSK